MPPSGPHSPIHPSSLTLPPPLQSLGSRRVLEHRNRLPSLTSANWSQASLSRLHRYSRLWLGRRQVGYPHCVSSLTSNSVIAHDIDTGDNLWYIERAHAGGVTALKLSHNMRFLLSGGVQGEVRLWELRSREMISHMKEHTQRITDIQIFDDDLSALTSSKDRCIMHWDLRAEVTFPISFSLHVHSEAIILLHPENGRDTLHRFVQGSDTDH